MRVPVIACHVACHAPSSQHSWVQEPRLAAGKGHTAARCLASDLLLVASGTYQIIIVGLNNAGKTTILYKLCAMSTRSGQP